VEEAVAKYLGPNYRQHNPGAKDGGESFIAFVKWFAQQYPSFHGEVKRIMAEGNLVITHTHLILEPGDAPGGNRYFSLETAKSLSTGTWCKLFPKSLPTTIRCFSNNFSFSLVNLLPKALIAVGFSMAGKSGMPKGAS